ncbi:4Fe-4S binding protein, partial [bacterium]|nr:4Fe-4S binding protein [bacterium]
MARITVDPFYCKGCVLCIEACPKNIIRLSDKFNEKGYHYA